MQKSCLRISYRDMSIPQAKSVRLSDQRNILYNPKAMLRAIFTAARDCSDILEYAQTLSGVLDS